MLVAITGSNPAAIDTDLASIPDVFRWYVNTYGEHTLPSILHDRLCESLRGQPDRVKITVSRSGTRMTRKIADDLFYESMEENGVAYVRRKLMWSAVVTYTRLLLSNGSTSWPMVFLLYWALPMLAGAAVGLAGWKCQNIWLGLIGATIYFAGAPATVVGLRQLRMARVRFMAMILWVEAAFVGLSCVFAGPIVSARYDQYAFMLLTLGGVLGPWIGGMAWLPGRYKAGVWFSYGVLLLLPGMIGVGISKVANALLPTLMQPASGKLVPAATPIIAVFVMVVFCLLARAWEKCV